MLGRHDPRHKHVLCVVVGGQHRVKLATSAAALLKRPHKDEEAAGALAQRVARPTWRNRAHDSDHLLYGPHPPLGRGKVMDRRDANSIILRQSRDVQRLPNAAGCRAHQLLRPPASALCRCRWGESCAVHRRRAAHSGRSQSSRVPHRARPRAQNAGASTCHSHSRDQHRQNLAQRSRETGGSAATACSACWKSARQSHRIPCVRDRDVRMYIRILVRRGVALTMPRRDIHRLGRTSHDVIGGQQRCLRNEEDRHAAASTRPGVAGRGVSPSEHGDYGSESRVERPSHPCGRDRWIRPVQAGGYRDHRFRAPQDGTCLF